MRKPLRIVLATLVAMMTLLAPQAGRAEGPHVVGLDPTGDWGENAGDTGESEVGNQLGQDLIEAAIDNPAEGKLVFIIKVAHLPEIGGAPEVSRYTWDLEVAEAFGSRAVQVELDGKFTNYSRGACDPTGGSCPPPRDPGMAPFLIRGDCEGESPKICIEKGITHATFDPSTGEIKIPVDVSVIAPTFACPLEIRPGVNLFGGSLSASPAAFVSSSAVNADIMGLDDDEINIATVC